MLSDERFELYGFSWFSNVKLDTNPGDDYWIKASSYRTVTTDVTNTVGYVHSKGETVALGTNGALYPRPGRQRNERPVRTEGFPYKLAYGIGTGRKQTVSLPSCNSINRAKRDALWQKANPAIDYHYG